GVRRSEHMVKIIITTLLAFLLLAPQAAVEAREKGKEAKHDQRFHKSKSHKFKRFPHAVKSELESLNQSISEINARIDALELAGGGGLPPDLAATLAALQAAIDTNSGDIVFALDGINGNLAEIQTLIDNLNANGAQLNSLELAVVDLESRILALEQSGLTGSDLIFSGYFIKNFESRFSLKFDWANFKSNATGSFSSIEIKNDLGVGGSAVCADPVVATQIVNELNTLIPVSGAISTFTCLEPTLGMDVYWNVGESGGEVELNAQLIEAGVAPAVSQCEFGAVVRPLNPSRNWGGVGSNFGGASGTCNALSQTLEVVLTR
ncbi:MAG: hypothetical protein ACC663_07775, partial [Gammaproteobacteria bacterium]